MTDTTTHPAVDPTTDPTTDPATDTAPVTVTAEHLRSLLAATIPLADGYDHLVPVLNAVHLAVHDRHLVAYATDRFRIGWKRVPLAAAAPAGWRAAISLGDACRLLDFLSATVSVPVDDEETGEVTGREDAPIEAGAVTLTAADATLRVALPSGAAVSLPVVSGSLPDEIADLAGQILTVPAAGDVTVNPALLADFADAASDGDRMALTPIRLTRGGALRVTIGDSFVAALMGVRPGRPGRPADGDTNPAREDLLADWLDLTRALYTLPAPSGAEAAR